MIYSPELWQFGEELVILESGSEYYLIEENMLLVSSDIISLLSHILYHTLTCKNWGQLLWKNIVIY